jgi:methionyl-tRNA formyltransferase
MGGMKTVFLGTAWESLETLKVLHEDEYFEIVCVITTPDKPVGRKQVMTPSEVKKYALENNIPVVHTDRKKEEYMMVLENYKPDIVVCKAFGEIIPKEFLEYPKYGCINIHFSLLPKYRGAVPIQKAILEGEEETGITIMLMSEGLDEGNILISEKEKIERGDTNISLRKRLVEKSKDLLIPTLKDWIKGNIKAVPQDSSKATYCWQKDVSKENAEIIWEKYEPKYIDRMVRAFLPWPVAWTKLKGNLPLSLKDKKMKIFECELIETHSEKNPGDIFVFENMVLFATKDSSTALRIKTFQIEGKNETNEEEFLNGLGRSLKA